ncbi:polyphosphate kinase 2 family protein [Sediminicoccus sp. KRV36]|uniref:polyphosphate kinase 2 family protein n=1 Tax=Sediminicoccus sp. KRV36 TaxID=3133721 RepID=UPI00200DD561|nr:polyphosphate kinase 2 family protein [Sediminicoccus rosea]UPY38044.1 polyphosphate kinase 2 family protein [Sediminicoccus rosea]
MNIPALDLEVEKKLARYRVEGPRGFRLAKQEPADTSGLKLSKEEASALLQFGVDRLSAEQDKLYAQDRWSVLCLFQAMDAAGKDGTIKHVFSGLNPQGCHVVSFKQPGPVELDHDFLWRHVTALPTRGQIGIHNRSWYEEVLVARVHPRVLAGQKLPDARVTKDIWNERLEDIAGFERYLARQGVVVLKFFLNVSQAEQKRRFLARLDEPEKNWKFSPADVAERRHWDSYMDAYEKAIRATATEDCPWYVVPADNKWFTRLIVVAAINRALKALKLHYPVVTEAQRAALAEARAALG